MPCSSELVRYQSVESIESLGGQKLDKAHIKPKAKCTWTPLTRVVFHGCSHVCIGARLLPSFSAGSEEEDSSDSNRLALSLHLHRTAFNGINSVTGVPQVVVTVDTSVPITVGPVAGRHRVSLLFEFVDVHAYPTPAALACCVRFKAGSELVQGEAGKPIVWRTYVDVVDVPMFQSCVAWKAKNTRKRIAGAVLAPAHHATPLHDDIDEAADEI